MPFGIAEAIATISAGMQAIDMYARYGGTRAQVIQTLDLKYEPSQYRSVETQIQTLGSAYEGLFSAAGDRVTDCIKGFTDAIRDDQLPHEREKLGNSATACVCRQIKLLKDFMGDRIPEELKKVWREHECDDFFGGLGGKIKEFGGTKRKFVSQRERLAPLDGWEQARTVWQCVRPYARRRSVPPLLRLLG